MEKLFHKKVVLVTGGSYGIGRAAAIAFARRGAKVVVSDCTEDKKKETLKQIVSAGSEGIFVKCDVSKNNDVQSLLDKCIEVYGRLDYTFTNAGIEAEFGDTQECPEAYWDKTLAVNLKGTWLCMKMEKPRILNNNSTIVNCASVAGLVGFAGLPAYVASKHAIMGQTKTGALDYSNQKIEINALCSGVRENGKIGRLTRTGQLAENGFVAMETAVRRENTEDVAEAVVWLCAEAASFMKASDNQENESFGSRYFNPKK